jgi:hypothetical protein
MCTRYTWYRVYRVYVIELSRRSIRDARSGLADAVGKAAVTSQRLVARRGIPIQAAAHALRTTLPPVDQPSKSHQ